MLERIGERLRAYAQKDGRGYPDWALRYAPIVRKLRRRMHRRARIIEIGTNENGFARFARRRVIAVDIDRDHLDAARAAQDVLAVLADMCALPFAAGCADLCICVDTLEHVPPEKRSAALNEIARVIRESGIAVAAFPAGAAAVSAEQTVQAAYRKYVGRSLAWLDEHRQRGLPDPRAVVQTFKTAVGNTHRVFQFGNAPVWLWRWMWRILLCGWPGRGNALFQALLRAITPLLTRIRFGTCYRTVIWVEPKKKDVERT